MHARQDSLSKKDGEGTACAPMGRRLRLEITTYVGFMLSPRSREMIKVQWGKIGIQPTCGLERSLLNSRRAANETQISMEIMWGTENITPIRPVNLSPTIHEAVGPLYASGSPLGAGSGKTPPGRLKDCWSSTGGFSAPEKQALRARQEDLAQSPSRSNTYRHRRACSGLMGLECPRTAWERAPEDVSTVPLTLHPKQSKRRRRSTRDSGATREHGVQPQRRRATAAAGARARRRGGWSSASPSPSPRWRALVLRGLGVGSGHAIQDAGRALSRSANGCTKPMVRPPPWPSPSEARLEGTVRGLEGRPLGVGGPPAWCLIVAVTFTP